MASFFQPQSDLIQKQRPTYTRSASQHHAENAAIEILDHGLISSLYWLICLELPLK